MARLLVVEDEERIRRFLVRALSSEHEVATAATGPEGLRMALTTRYDLIVLDLLLPGLDGGQVLGELMQHDPDQRVIVLSALPDVQTRVQVLEQGAADFVPKPFAAEELLARIRTRLRVAGRQDGGSRVTVGDLSLDLVRQRLKTGDKSVVLSQRETGLMRHLMVKAGQVCRREDLLEDVWGYSFDPGSNVVDVYIKRLRAKVSSAEIETVRSVGYCLRAG